MTADQPDHAAWLSAMDAATDQSADRHGLDGRIETELVAGEPVLVVDQGPDGWSRVVAAWQPHHDDPRGYPGYVRSAHLELNREPDAPAPLLAGESAGAAQDQPTSGPFDIAPLVEEARTYLGLTYLWGGCSIDAIDCSGLIHRSARAHGVLVPRDADDQQVFSDDIALGTERFGDLYFFAYPGKAIHHVGFVIEPGRMLHAPGNGSHVVDEPLSQDRQDTLVAAGRLPGSRRG